jgi:ketosteroid isomerase-like protein
MQPPAALGFQRKLRRWSMPNEIMAVVNRHFDATLQGDMQALAEVLADNYVAHAPDGDYPGKQAQIDRFQRGVSGFTIDDFKIHDQFAADDKVVTRFSATVTQTATGKQATRNNIHISRVENGKIVETWRMSDDVQFMQQLGISSMPSR